MSQGQADVLLNAKETKMALKSRGITQMQCSASWKQEPLLSGWQGRAGEAARAARWLEVEGVGGRGGGGRHLAWATQVSIMELPQQLLVLHRQTLVHLGLLMKRLLQHGLLCRQLPAVHQHRVRDEPRPEQSISSYTVFFFFFKLGCTVTVTYAARLTCSRYAGTTYENNTYWPISSLEMGSAFRTDSLDLRMLRGGGSKILQQCLVSLCFSDKFH